jgi:hypothetical protein
VRTSRARSWRAATAAGALTLIAAACSGSHHSTAPTTAAPTDAPSPASTGAPTTTTTLVQHPLPSPQSIPNSPDRRSEVTLTSCVATANGWAAGGNAANPTNTATNYTITVFFTTSNATVLDYAQTTVNVPPGRSTEWNTSANFTAPSRVLCVLRGVG